MKIALTVNGTAHTLEAAPDARLLDVLREYLGLGGPREGCGIGACGACTVLLDGAPVSSCLVLMGQAEGHTITTVEGLAKPKGALSAVQQAFIDHRAFQCSYCTPGFVLAATALLEANPAPSDDDITEALTGNLCRCGSYRNIVEAVASLRRQG
ncbi:MAG: (2Fe-2S)-binding protein [Chloroflexota bacterium]